MSETLRDMALFVDIARAGSLSKASASGGVSVSTLSRRLAAFERRLGFQLVKRSTRKFELTELGAQYFAECQRLVADAAIAHERLLQRGSQVAGKLKISMTPDFGALVFAPLLGDFARAHPDVDFELDLTPHFADLIDNDIDVAIRFGQPADSRLTMRRIGTIRHWLAASPNYLSRHGEPKTPADLASHDGIILRRANHPRPFVLTRGGREAALKLRPRFHTNHMSMLVSLALMDLGIVLLPDVMGTRPVADGKLVRLLRDWKLPSVPLLAITPSRMQPARCRLFLDFVAARVSEVLSAGDD